MHIKTIAFIFIATGLTTTAFAYAGAWGDQPGYDRIQLAQRGDERDRRDADRGRDDRGGNEGRRDFRADRHEGRGAGPEHRFYRGDRLPSAYRHRNYVVDDWRSHRLSAPPRGYHWVQTGGDYVLAAIATGIIADILINGN